MQLLQAGITEEAMGKWHRKDDSTKNQPRQERGATAQSSKTDYHISLNALVLSSKADFLSSGTNKSALAKIYTDFVTNSYRFKLPDNLSMQVEDMMTSVSKHQKTSLKSMVTSRVIKKRLIVD